MYRYSYSTPFPITLKYNGKEKKAMKYIPKITLHMINMIYICYVHKQEPQCVSQLGRSNL